MPANKSSNKVRVTKLLGGTGFIGLMDPKVNMQTNQGKILSLDSGNYTVVVGRGTGNFKQKFYPHDLFVTQAHATGVHAFPTGDGSVVFGHKGVFPNGIPPG